MAEWDVGSVLARALHFFAYLKMKEKGGKTRKYFNIFNNHNGMLQINQIWKNIDNYILQSEF